MDPRAADWFARRTSQAADWPLDRVLELKGERRISVVIPARNEEATVADVVAQIRADLVDGVPLVDELVVIDSLSSDATSQAAASARATVHHVADVVPELGVRAGKGEALWKSLFVTRGDVLVFVDADLTDWGTHFVTGLVGPMLADDATLLVKGFYDRVLDLGIGVSAEGGRVTELVARPLLATHWPELAGVVQPLAGEWAIRRSLFASLPVPVGYGVELATLLDTATRHGIDAIAQVDLGHRAHRHQNLHDLGAMAAELLVVAERRLGLATPEPLSLARFASDRTVTEKPIPTDERPPAATTTAYAPGDAS